MKKIGDTAKQFDVSIDTLRYYEKIRLLDGIHRTSSGIRLYSEDDCAKIHFIKHAQYMGFSLEEIKLLLNFREQPEQAKPQVRLLARQKLKSIDEQIASLSRLRNELSSVVDSCQNNPMGQAACPILDKFESSS